MIECDFHGLDGERVTVGISAGGAVMIDVYPAPLAPTDEPEPFGVALRGRDAFRLAEFVLDVLAKRDRDRERVP